MTTLYLIRHGATDANIAKPSRLQGRTTDPELAPEGKRQAERTRDFLRSQPIDYFYASPLRRALETAQLIAEPHGKIVRPVAALTECDVGSWDGLSWEAIQQRFPEAYERFMADPAAYGYADGENFTEVARRVCPALDQLLEGHADQTLVVVAHNIVNRVYLAGLMGLPPSQARQVNLDNCGVSIIVRQNLETRITTLNATSHLHDSAA